METSFHVRTKSREYPVHVGHALLPILDQILDQETDRVFIVTDDIVSNIHLKPVLEALQNSEIEISTKILPSGESTKSLDRAQNLYCFLGENLGSRSDAILALGGGVIGDLAGFVASTFKRGMKLLQVPTTLLAQVDASLGGKTAVNLEWGKNLVGTFYQPHRIIADVATLRTLSDDHYATGLAEVIKYSIIMDPKLLQMLKEKRNEIIQRNLETITTIVERCLRNKARIVEKDETEHGTRQILNFGHTVGHAIETCSEHSISHGEAVAIGMLEEARYAVRIDALDNQFLEELESLLCSFDLPTVIPSSLSKEDLKDVMKQDKKVRHGGLSLPILVELGRVEMKVVDGISI
ncbi:MAG: 3-dehydroquinate synthase [Candidatus Lokiarchaeota archaeon]|nr:3-dehydroquinate synthase [Candidatus Lokiarchaeota archaeon]